MNNRNCLPIGYIISRWKPNDAQALFELEKKTWAPWLRTPEKNFATIAKIFPEGQYKISNFKKKIIAAITTNRINWDGNPTSLHSWDSAAGGSVESGDYSSTFTPNGNTLSLMSIAVDPAMQGRGLASILFQETITNAINLKIKHLICSLRPNNYGNFKLQAGHESIGLEEYCKITNLDGLPIDPWLRIATKQKLTTLRIEQVSMKVQVSLEKFEEYRKSYNKDLWKQNKNGSWECGEVGTWTIKDNIAVYTESNLWGEIPIH